MRHSIWTGPWLRRRTGGFVLVGLGLLGSPGSSQGTAAATELEDLRRILASPPQGAPLGLAYLLDCADLLIEQGYLVPEARLFELAPAVDLERMRQELERADASAEELAWFDWESALTLDFGGQRAAALELLRRASEEYDDDNGYLPWILVDLASREREAARTQVALDALERVQAIVADEARRVSVSGDTRSLEAAHDEELAAVYIELGMPDLARPLLVRARALAEEVADPVQWAGCLLRQSNLAHALHDFDAQLELVREFQRHPLAASVPGDVRAQIHLRFALAELEMEFRGMRAVGDAERSLRELVTGGELSAPERFLAEEALVRTLLDRGELERAREELDALWAKHGPANVDAPEFSTREIGLVTLRARLAAHDPRGALDPAQELPLLRRAYAALLQKWQRAPLRQGGLGLLSYAETTRVLGELMRLDRIVHGPEEGARRALETLLAAQSMGTLARTHQIAVPEVREVCHELLGEKTGALLYLGDRERSHLVAVERDEVRYIELAPRYQLDQARKDLERCLGPGLSGTLNRESFDAAVDALSALLLPPELRDLVGRWSSVWIVGSDSLGYVPFECLRFGDGERLGLAKAISYLPSLPLGLWLSRREPETNAAQRDFDVCLVAAPDLSGRPHPRWPNLDLAPFTDADADSILGPYATDRTRRFLGDDVSTELFSGTLSTDRANAATVLQVVTHGVYDPQRERPAGLLLSSGDPSGGVLWCEDVERWSAPPLVILTACGAARAPLRRGDDGRGHLGGAFLAAGAQAVVLSATDVPYVAGLRLMTHFHRELAQGLGPAEALRRARAHGTPAGEPDLSALLVHVVGLGDVPRLAAPTQTPDDRPGRWGQTLLVLAALVSIGFVWRVRRARSGGL